MIGSNVMAMTDRRVLVGICVVLLLVGTKLSAHHSPILFDRGTRLALSGTVAEFAWMNPHASIQLDVPNAGGGVDRWGIEMNSPNNLVKDGWKSTLIKTGDKVTVLVNPLRSGEHGGIFVSIKLADGRVFGDKWTEQLEAKKTARR
jgi:hypothetical protein